MAHHHKTPVRHYSGFVAEHPLPDGSRFSVSTGAGTKSESRLYSDGRIDLTVHRNPDAGTRGEPSVLKVLAEHLRTDAHVVDVLPDARDDRAEDFVLKIDGVRQVVQVTVIPQAEEFWREASGGEANRSYNTAESVAEIRAGILNKKLLPGKNKLLLALDVRHIPPFADPRIVAAYLATHPNPSSEEFDWREVWIVGPTPTRCVQLSKA